MHRVPGEVHRPSAIMCCRMSRPSLTTSGTSLSTIGVTLATAIQGLPNRSQRREICVPSGEFTGVNYLGKLRGPAYPAVASALNLKRTRNVMAERSRGSMRLMSRQQDLTRQTSCLQIVHVSWR
jgi:hypothetical protein